MDASLIPVTLLTGFLGSGKTTVLNHLVRQPELADALVIINEFGEIALDHMPVAHSAGNLVMEMSSGCLCCTIRGDLVKTLRDITRRLGHPERRRKPSADRHAWRTAHPPSARVAARLAERGPPLSLDLHYPRRRSGRDRKQVPGVPAGVAASQGVHRMNPPPRPQRHRRG
jgi:hypothetical protein